MPEFKVNVEFSVYCSICGEGICKNCYEKVSESGRTLSLMVEPCENCIRKAKDEAYQEGYDEGVKMNEKS